MVRVPPHDWARPRQVPDDGWMRLRDAILWVAWRGEPIPKFGAHEFDDGTWIDAGDRNEEDQRRENEAAEEIRAALTVGKLVAWSREAYREPVELGRGRWARELGELVSDVDWAGIASPIVVERARVEQIWPSAPPKRGAPPKHDWVFWRQVAEEIVAAEPAISKSKLVLTLPAEAASRGWLGKVPHERQIRAHLTGWGIPPAK